MVLWLLKAGAHEPAMPSTDSAGKFKEDPLQTELGKVKLGLSEPTILISCAIEAGQPFITV